MSHTLIYTASSWRFRPHENIDMTKCQKPPSPISVFKLTIRALLGLCVCVSLTFCRQNHHFGAVLAQQQIKLRWSPVSTHHVGWVLFEASSSQSFVMSIPSRGLKQCKSDFIRGLLWHIVSVTRATVERQSIHMSLWFCLMSQLCAHLWVFSSSSPQHGPLAIPAITVCTIVQNPCNGRSKKYRKWHYRGCSLSETLQWINIKFGRDDYVGDVSQYAKWHINRFKGVISAKGWNVNGLCLFYFYIYFFIFSSFFSAARVQTVGPILTSDTSKCVFLGELHAFWG